MASKRGEAKGMRYVREILRLNIICGIKPHGIGQQLKISHNTAKRYLEAARVLGLDWPRINAMSDDELERMLGKKPKPADGRPLPDLIRIHAELKKPGVTLALLWQEYKEVNPDGYQLTQFYRMYESFTQTLRITLRQSYVAGEVMFVDYAGQKVPIYDRDSGLVREAEIFVAVLGASNFSFADATMDQGLESWIVSHVRAFEYFGGVPGKVVIDNLKSGVNKTCRYEPELNRTYADMIAHYGTAVIPARVRKPQDKAKVEAGVQLVQRWILAALRNRKFFSLAELNQAIRELLVKLNNRPFQKLPGSRQSVYEQLERPALKALPDSRYEYAQWKKAKVNIDYHIELEGHYYSVPYQLVGQEVLVRYTVSTVEIYQHNRRISSHARNNHRGRHSTVREHMPKSHQEYMSWTPSRIIDSARQIGQETAAMVEEIMNGRQHVEQGYRSCLGIIRLARHYSPARVEAACARGRKIGARSYSSIASILKNSLDQQSLPASTGSIDVSHENIRGSGYFN